MNRNHHRIVFNAARGQLMAVSETASSHTRSSASGESPASAAQPKRWRMALLAAGCALLWPAHAQIAADPAAPGAQRPTVLNAANGVPLVNITTPSAAGVSRNTYRQFDVNAQGAIANTAPLPALRVDSHSSSAPTAALTSTISALATLNPDPTSGPVAGNTAARTGDAETGIAPIFDKERVRDEVEAQVAITKAFGQQASKTVGDYAGRKFEELKQTNPKEAAKWAEGGVYRVLAHAVVGALTGGSGGAMGAGAAALSADAIDQFTQDLPEGVRTVVGAAIAAGIGAMAGGSSGAASAFNADMNNRQLHPDERRLSKDLARKSSGKYTQEQIEEQMRLMGNSAFHAAPNSTEVLTTPEAIANNLLQDPSMPKAADGKVVVEVPGQADAAIQQYIIGNSTNGANYIPGQSPYLASNAALNPRSTTYSPGNAPTTATCANSDLACKSGVGAQQSSIPELTDVAKNAIADSAAVTSRAAGVVAAGATAAMASASPATKPMAGAIALGATGVGIVADTVSYLANPDPKKSIKEQFEIGFPASVLSERYPLWAPIINEVAEELKK